jgi:DNA-binding beta-propeller fold protein YncE
VRLRVVLLLALAVLGGGAAALAGPGRAVVGPNEPGGPITGNGRQLHPYGRLTTVGNFPAGGALTPDGRFYWSVSAGRGVNDIRIVDVGSGAVVQTLYLPGGEGGIVMDPTKPVAYVAGTPIAAGNHPDLRPPAGSPQPPGVEGDVLHVYTYDPASGRATEQAPLSIPPPSNTPPPQNFPPTNTKAYSWPAHLAISPDGSRLLVPLNLADAAAIVKTAGRSITYVSTGNYPYGAAILPDGKTGLVSNETDGTVSVIDLDAGETIGAAVKVGEHLSHPEAIAVDPVAPRAYVAVANTDQVAVLDTADRAHVKLAKTLSVGRDPGRGTSPTALAVSPDGRRLVVAESGADELAVFSLTGATAAPPGTKPKKKAGRKRGPSVRVRRCHRRHAFHFRFVRCRHHHKRKRHQRAARLRGAAPSYALLGRIPTAAYPTDVQISAGDRLVWAAGKGAGTGPNAFGDNQATVGPRLGPNPYGDDGSLFVGYLPSIVKGQVGVGPLPTNPQLPSLTAVADAQVVPVNHRTAPADTPLRPGGPIKHVFYIVRENRTYDQVLGDESRADSDPSLVLFGRNVTPNFHALVERFGIVDHFFANSEASIDGHFWTSAGAVSDYVVKNWNQNYRDSGRPYDFGVYSVTWPGSGFLFDQAERQGISYFNYGEAIAGTVPLTDKDRTSEESALVSAKFAKSDLGSPAGCYPNDAYIGKNAIDMQPVFDSDPAQLTPPQQPPPTTESRTRCFRTRFATQVATNRVPAFNYLVLTNDHTVGTSAGQYSPRAMVADNDLAVGQIVDTISHSAIWSSSAIFVVEDDSQNGPDHVDAHRIPVAVISPYTVGGVVHTRYDFPSAIRSMELIVGMKPLSLNDALATPMYDAFQAHPPQSNFAPFTAVPPTYPLFEKNATTGRLAREAARLPLSRPDRVSQRALDRLLYRSIRGLHTKVPPPGPNASHEPDADG